MIQRLLECLFMRPARSSKLSALILKYNMNAISEWFYGADFSETAGLLTLHKISHLYETEANYNVHKNWLLIAVTWLPDVLHYLFLANNIQFMIFTFLSLLVIFWIYLNPTLSHSIVVNNNPYKHTLNWTQHRKGDLIWETECYL